MTVTMLCITFVGIVLSCLLLFYLFLDTFVNTKAELQNQQVKSTLDKLVMDRLDQLKQSTGSHPVSLDSRISILNRFIAEVKRH